MSAQLLLRGLAMAGVAVAALAVAPAAANAATQATPATVAAQGIAPQALSAVYWYGTTESFGSYSDHELIGISCWGYGNSYQGDNVWYEDENGSWVPGAALDTGADPNPNVPHYPSNCASTSSATHTRPSAVTPAATTGNWFGYLPGVGAGGARWLYCWYYGSSVGGDDIWYSSGNGNIPGDYLDTGSDPNPNVPEC